MTTGDVGRPLVLVTGSSGLIGTRLVADFAKSWRVVGLDRSAPRTQPTGVDFIGCDLTDDASVAKAFQSVRERHGDHLASVVHLAAYYDFSGEPSPLYDDLTVQGTRRVIAALRDFHAEQFVFSSTLLVLKPADEEGEVLTETSEVGAEWDYPQSKIAAEDVIRRERGSIPAVVLRIAGVYDDGGHSIPIAQHIKRIREKTVESYFFPGDADHGQPFVHTDDLMACFRAVVERRDQLAPLEVFLVAEPDVMSYRDLQEELGRLLHGKAWPTIRIPVPLAKAGAWAKEKLGAEESFIKPWMVDLADDHYPVAIDRARAKLGWEPRRRLRTTLPGIIATLERDPREWYREHELSWSEEEAS
jgi:nucleoside-diphosphate-sugar epimerase